MKTIISVSILLFLMLSQLSTAQKMQAISSKIENYSKGNLEIKVAPFGLDGNEIKVGYISSDGSIHLAWPEINLEDYRSSGLMMNELDFLLGMYHCHDEKIEEKNEEIKAADTKFFMLYKYDQYVGSLHPASHKDITKSTDLLTIGSYFSWYYSNGDGKLNAVCTSYNHLKDSNEVDINNIRNTKTFNINFKKGWNLVEHKLAEVRDQEINGQLMTTRYKEEKLSIDELPNTVNWHLNYFANDELLEFEHNLVALSPLTKQDFERWMPKELGDLKRTDYELGKILERLPITNNVNLLFEKGLKTIDIIIVDCAGSKDGAGMYTMMQGMASRDWKDKTETGYRSASVMDDQRVMIDYNELEVKTILSYNAKDRFLIKAEATNIEPHELWNHLKTLHLDTLME